jgi:hypothetical protein
VPVLRELLARELLMLIVLAGLGAGPASLLSARFRAVERVALAPVLGMCLGTAVFTTLIYFFPASDTDWLVPVLVVASVVVAAVRSRRTLRLRLLRAQLAGWVSLALVIVVVTVPILSVMRSQHTVGPVSYAVGDAVGYIAEIDGMVRQSLHDASEARPPFRNLAQRSFTTYGQGYQNLDLAPVSANVDSVAGSGSTDTWQAFLIAFVVTGALGALAAVRWMLRESSVRSITLGGAAAGVMFAGALFLQLYFADSQAALCGLAMLLPLGAVAADAAMDPRPAALALTALPVTGLLAAYPLFVAPSAVAGAGALLFLALRRWRSGRPRVAADMRRGARRVTFVIVLAACLNLVALLRDLRYWKALVTGQLNPTQFGFPVFDMRAESLPAWLFQTRNLFTLFSFGDASFVVKGEEIALPLLFAGIVIIGLRRFPILCWLVVVIAVAALLGEYEAVKNACSYCTDRSLLPIGPILVGLIAVGLGVLWMSERPLLRATAFVALALWLIPAFTAERDIRNRVSGAGTFLDSSERIVLTHLPRDAAVAVEGFDADPASASPADPFAYELAEERSNGQATIPGDVNNYNAIAYFGVSALNAGQFNPYYRYVLTRLPGIATARQVVARGVGVALEKRVRPLDVTVDGGLVAPAEGMDPAGNAWLSNTMPLRLIVAGPGSGPAYVGLLIDESVPTRVTPRQPGVRWRLHGHQMTVCVRAVGTAPFRVAQFGLFYNPVPSSTAAGPYAQPPVGIGVRLAAMRAAAGRCPFAGIVR